MIATEMEAARVLAVSRGASYRMEFDPSNNTVRIIDVEDPDNPPRALKQLERGVSVLAPSTPIIFYPRGHASASETVQVSNGEGSLQVAVLLSGKVTVGTTTYMAQSQPNGGTGTTPPTGGTTGGTTGGATGGATSGAATGSSVVY